MFLEHIRLSQQARDQLIKLKRITGLKNWNVLCRWAFCVSIAESTPPANVKVPADSNVEMTWSVFGGEYAELYAELVRERARADGYDETDESLAQVFRLHLHRGISYLAGDKKLQSIADLIEKATTAANIPSGFFLTSPVEE
jgi:DNA sulfur modification protein DndE